MRSGFAVVAAVALLLLVAGCSSKVENPDKGLALPSEPDTSEQPPTLPPAGEADESLPFPPSDDGESSSSPPGIFGQ